MCIGGKKFYFDEDGCCALRFLIYSFACLHFFALTSRDMEWMERRMERFFGLSVVVVVAYRNTTQDCNSSVFFSLSMLAGMGMAWGLGWILAAPYNYRTARTHVGCRDLEYFFFLG